MNAGRGPAALAALTAAIAFTTETAFAGAAAGGGANTLDLAASSGMLTSVIAFATGPVARAIAVLCIIAGAGAFARGRDEEEGVKYIGIIAITLGLLIGATSLFGNPTLGAGI